MSRRSLGSPTLGGSVGRTAADSVGGRPAETPPPSPQQAFCPHCQLLVADDAGAGWPPQATRCPHCRLLIGAGRARPEPAGEPGARGTAAGMFAGAAKRADGHVGATADEVREAIREVAAEIDTPPERLLMVDYQQRAAVKPELPPLRAVFAVFGSWKKARREAAVSG
jgi:hypothetical protein